MIEEISHYDTGDEVTRYTYDAQGNLVQIENEWVGGWKSVEKITCDKDGNWLSSESWTYNENGELQSDVTYYYNAETGEIEKWTEKYPDGSSAVTTSQLEFDKDGFLTRETQTRVDDDGQGNVYTTVFVYEYARIPYTRLQQDWPTRYYPEMPEG